MRFSTLFPAAALLLGAGSPAMAQQEGLEGMEDMSHLTRRGMTLSQQDIAQHVPPACMPLITNAASSCSSTVQNPGPNNNQTMQCIAKDFATCGVIPQLLYGSAQAHLKNPDDPNADKAFTTQRMRFLAALMAIFSKEKISDITEGTPLAQAVLAYFYDTPNLNQFITLAQDNPSLLAGVLKGGGGGESKRDVAAGSTELALAAPSARRDVREAAVRREEGNLVKARAGMPFSLRKAAILGFFAIAAAAIVFVIIGLIEGAKLLKKGAEKVA